MCRFWIEKFRKCQAWMALFRFYCSHIAKTPIDTQRRWWWTVYNILALRLTRFGNWFSCRLPIHGDNFILVPIFIDENEEKRRLQQPIDPFQLQMLYPKSAQFFYYTVRVDMMKSTFFLLSFFSFGHLLSFGIIRFKKKKTLLTRTTQSHNTNAY